MTLDYPRCDETADWVAWWYQDDNNWMAIKFSVLVSKLARLGFLGHWITQVCQEKYMKKDTKHDIIS